MPRAPFIVRLVRLRDGAEVEVRPLTPGETKALARFDANLGAASRAFFLPHARAWEFVTGAAIALDGDAGLAAGEDQQRLGDFTLQGQRQARLGTPQVEALIASGNTAARRARLVELIRTDHGPTVGACALDDTLESIRDEMRKFADSEVVAEGSALFSAGAVPGWLVATGIVVFSGLTGVPSNAEAGAATAAPITSSFWRGICFRLMGWANWRSSGT